MTLHPANSIISRAVQVLCSHKFSITETTAMRTTVLTINCDSRDAGRILGAACMVLNALRAIAGDIGRADGRPCNVELAYDRSGPRGERKTVVPVKVYDSNPAFDWLGDVLDLALDNDYAIDLVNTDEFTIIEVIPYGYAPDKLFLNLNVILSAWGAATGRPKLKIERADKTAREEQ